MVKRTILKGAFFLLHKLTQDQTVLQIAEYVVEIAELKAVHAEELRQLTEEVASLKADNEAKMADLLGEHEEEVARLQAQIDNLAPGRA